MQDSEVLTVEPVERKPPWGTWASIGLGLVVFIVMNVTQAIVLLIYMAVSLTGDQNSGFETMQPDQLEELTQSLESNGDFFALATLVSTPICVGLIALFAIARHGPPLGDYLALRAVSTSALVRSLALALAIVFAWDALSVLLDRPIVPDIMVKIYDSASALWLLWIAVILAGPLFEEVFFRGFLLEGLRHGHLGALGAISLTALLWAALHIQYGLYEISTIFLLGLILGYVRLRTGSLYPPLAMHAVVNLGASLQVAGYWFYS